MQPKKIHIGIFATSLSLIERVQILAAKQQDQIFINTQGLDDAIPLAQEMVRNGVEIIISRRGTAHLLRENLRIPMLSFPHRSLDILTSLKEAKARSHRILLPAFRNKYSGLGTLEELLQIKLIQKVYDDKTSLQRIVKAGRDQGCKVVVGGSVTQQIAETLGLKFIEIRTSDEDITATIEDAKSVALSARDQRATSLRYRAIINAASDGIIAVDDHGLITTINTTAATLLKLDEGDTLNRHISEVIPHAPITQVLTTKKPIQDRLAIPMVVCEESAGGGDYGDIMTFSGLMVYNVTAEDGFAYVGGIPHERPETQDDNWGACNNWWTQSNSKVKRSIFMDDYVYSIALDLINVSQIDDLGNPVAAIELVEPVDTSVK